ncbi:MAG TPA: undecaprenyldiphospho-muramoylpentapeptide beta-N-acetylglucosaminyltransferase [Stellaceae bacterium]|nr:undecaprenyldiphospho-muramoylpentapeptide beta-N-acetylglucosaminyltransferase [Stellaceae bacterium]
MTGPIVLAAGGTGGHLFPAEALARALLARGASVHLMTDRRADAFAAAVPGIMVSQIRAGRLGGGPLNAACGLAELALGMMQARHRLRRLMPAAAVGFGGYPSVPTMLAAAQLGCPTVIHEQNAVLGRANRLLAPRAGRIATAFPETAGLRPADQARTALVGNPVRPEIRAAATAYAAPDGDRPIELLVLGGSQGARVFSEIVPPALAALPDELRVRLRVSQQARPEDLAEVVAQYTALGIAGEIQSFFTDVPQRLARAQLVICRAGASTIAELAAVGRPAVLVPYPFAADDHQSANARAFAASGAGWVMPQAALTARVLADRIAPLFANPAALRAAAAAARRLSRDDAADALADLVLGLASGVMERAA